MGEYFPELESSRERVKVELDLSNYAAKANIKNAAVVDTWDSVQKTNSAKLKSDIDKLN